MKDTIINGDGHRNCVKGDLNKNNQIDHRLVEGSGSKKRKSMWGKEKCKTGKEKQRTTVGTNLRGITKNERDAGSLGVKKKKKNKDLSTKKNLRRQIEMVRGQLWALNAHSCRKKRRGAAIGDTAGQYGLFCKKIT